jgi:hypothetical protein
MSDEQPGMINAAFEQYLAAVSVGPVPEPARTFIKQAFFGGAAIMFMNIVRDGLTPGVLHALDEELLDFCEAMSGDESPSHATH